MDLLFKSCEVPTPTASNRSVIQFVLEMRDRMAEY